MDPYQQCVICGLPYRVLVMLLRRRLPSPMHPSVRTLTVDHVHPRSQGGGHTLENVRILCALCNTRRGNNERTDAVVLSWVRRQWYRLFTNRELWWLNKEPGSGGVAYRGKRHPRVVLRLPSDNALFMGAYSDLCGLPQARTDEHVGVAC